MARRWFAPVALALAAVIGACGAGGSTPSTPGTQVPSGVVEVRLTDTLRIEPDPILVPVGVPVTFRVTNTGVAEHEFYVGDETAQAEHEEDMAHGGMAHDDPNGISVAPGATGELTITFDAAGETLAGCHVPGHYAGGMKAVVRIGS
jgi:uncharacterized cupredoxin-like copper-binding protein